MATSEIYRSVGCSILRRCDWVCVRVFIGVSMRMCCECHFYSFFFFFEKSHGTTQTLSIPNIQTIASIMVTSLYFFFLKVRHSTF
jgi:hypothetical protein